MSRYFVSTVVVLNTVLGSFLSDTLNCTVETSDYCELECDNSNSCAVSTFYCPRDKDCIVKCNTFSQCTNLEINCPRNGKCSVECGDNVACTQAIIDCAFNTQDCKLICNGRSACYGAEIYWPIDPDVNRTLICDPDGNDHPNATLTSCYGLKQYLTLNTSSSQITTPFPTSRDNASPIISNTPSPTTIDNTANPTTTTQNISAEPNGNDASSDYGLTVLIAVITGVSCTCLWCSIGLYIYCKLLKRKGKSTKDIENLTVKQSNDNTASIKIKSHGNVGKNGVRVQDNEVSDDSMDRDTPEHIIDGNTMNVSSESVHVEDIEGYVEPQLNRFKTAATDAGIEELYADNHREIETYDGAGNTATGNQEMSIDRVSHNDAILDTSKYIG